MKNSIKWTILIVTAFFCVGVQAAFNPDTDSSLKFNLNFQNNPSPTQTIDAKAGLTGVLEDYNTIDFDVFRANEIRGICADFNQYNDAATGAGDNNDCGFIVNPNYSGPVFEFGNGDGDQWPGNDQCTFACWFNLPNISNGTFFRQEWQYDETVYWEIRVVSGKLSFRCSNNALRFETYESLSYYGLANNTWHHAVVIFDRSNARETSKPTKSLSCKMFIDGYEVPIVVTYFDESQNMAMDTYGDWASPLQVGRGERDMDGMLDEIRMYSRSLSALDVSLLHQYNPSVAHTTMLQPINKAQNVRIDTDVNWVPATGATAQSLYFGTDTNVDNLIAVKTGNGTLAKATNAELGGVFPLGQTYYWYVKSTIGGVDVNSPVWSFTTETGEALEPSPADEEDMIEVSGVSLSWTASATASSFDVYYSVDKSLVEAKDPSVQIADNITATTLAVNTSLRGQTYYWMVVSNYPSGSVDGDVWSFTTRPYEIIFNTSTAEASYQGGTIPALGVMVHANGWYSLRADGNSVNQPLESDVVGKIASDGVVIYDFNTFVFDKRFAITVIPAYRAQDLYNSSDIGIRPIAIHVNNGGDFYFDGKINISGDNVTVVSNYDFYSRCGGFTGPRGNSGTTTGTPDNLCWTDVSVAQPYYHKYGTTTSSKTVYVPDSNAYKYFGPGIGINPPYKGGGGASYGGLGGNCGRAYFYGMRSFGPTYGDKEIPVPFGGSAGGWSGNGPGAPGGGGIEIVAGGDVTLDVNSVINANGGNAAYTACDYPGGGGAGGSVKIIAGGNVTLKGIINAIGGNGGNTGKQANESGGGGAGGLIALFYGGTYTNGGVMSVRGGEKGVYTGGGASIAENGQAGTIYIVNSNVVSPKKASAPTPSNGDKQFYVSGTTMPLKWYSGLGASTDEVYYSTDNLNFTKVGAAVAATRGQHTSTANITVSPGQTYYFKVITDGTVSSDVWSFTVVNWQCPVAVASTSSSIKYAAGPTYDRNFDCVVTNDDFWYFAKDWKVERVSGSQNYTFDFPELSYLVNEWMECINRTDGCASW